MHGMSFPGAGPTLGSQALEAGGQIPTMLADQQKNKLAIEQQKSVLEKEKIDLEQNQQDAALKKLSLFSKLHANDPTGQRGMDPAYVKAVKDAAKAAGLGSMTKMDPVSGMEVVDTQALSLLTGLKKTIDEIPPEVMTQIHAANPGPQRDAVIEGAGLDLDAVTRQQPDLRTAPAVLPPKTQFDVLNSFAKSMSQLPAGMQTPEGIVSQLNVMRGELQSAGVDTAQISDFITSPAFVNQVLAPAASAKANLMHQLGVKDAVVSDWYKKRTELMPKEFASKVYFDGQKYAIQQENADTNKARQQSQADLGQKRIDNAQAALAETVKKDKANADLIHAKITNFKSTTDLKAAQITLGIRGGQVKSLETQRDALVKLVQAQISASGKAPSDDQLQQINQLNDAIQKARGDLDTYRQYVTKGGDPNNQALGQRLGKEVRDFHPATMDMSQDNIQTLVGQGWEYKSGWLRAPDGTKYNPEGIKVN